MAVTATTSPAGMVTELAESAGVSEYPACAAEAVSSVIVQLVPSGSSGLVTAVPSPGTFSVPVVAAGSLQV